MAIGINLGDDKLPQEGIGISSSFRERQDGPTPPWVVRMNSMEVGARMMDADSDYSTVPFHCPLPVAGLLEFPQAVPPASMALITAFCVGVTQSREPNQRIGRTGSPYMDRWLLARKALVPAFVNDYGAVDAGEGPRVSSEYLHSELENLYLHGYDRGDADEPHDHPWPNASLVVQGWYRERLYDERGQFVRCEMRRAGDVVLRSAGSIHAIVETSDDCLSLFATLRKEREWGFWRDETFVPWREFR